MSFNFNDTDRFTTNNGLILEVTDRQTILTSLVDEQDIVEEAFIFARAVGRVSGDNENLPKNLFVFRASDGRRFRQQAEDSGLNIEAVYVAPVAEPAPAPAVTAQAVTSTTASAWAVPPAPVAAPAPAPSAPVPPATAPRVGDRAVTRLGLVLEVVSVDYDDSDFDGQWVISSRAVGRDSSSNSTNIGRPLPRNTFRHNLNGERIDDVVDPGLTQIVRGHDGDIAYDEDLSAVDEQPAVPASQVLGDNLPR